MHNIYFLVTSNEEKKIDELNLNCQFFNLENVTIPALMRSLLLGQSNIVREVKKKKTIEQTSP